MDKKIYKIIPLVMGEIGAIEKAQTNSTQGQGYKFRGIDDVYAAVHKPFSKHGIFVVPEVLEHIREERTSRNGANLIYSILKVGFKFYADDGSFVEATTMGEAMDSGDKSCNKAMSAAMKYAILQVFSVPTREDKDTENETHEVAPKAPQTTHKAQGEVPANKLGQPPQEDDIPPFPPPPGPTGPTISPAQGKRLFAIAMKNGWTKDQFNAAVFQKFQVERSEHIPKKEHDAAEQMFQGKPS